MSKILRIHNGGQANQEGWYKSRKISHDDINSIEDGASTGGKLRLNSVPSPLARMHLFDTAFTLVEKFERNGGKEINSVYEQLVSNCFDVLELIFNWQTHLQSGAQLSIDVWDVTHETESLKSSSKEHALVGTTLEMFFKQDFPKVKRIFIFKLDGRPFAGTSPLTVTFTTPNNLDRFNLKNPNNNGKPYFSEIRSFDTRSDAFRIYIYNEISAQSQFDSVKKYLDNKRDSLQKINSDINVSSLISTDGLEVETNGFILKYGDATGFNHNRSKIIINSSFLPKSLNGRRPVLFKPSYNSLGEFQQGVEMPEMISGNLSQRLLPDNGVNYPWIYANDFLEDHIIRLPYRLNDSKFHSAKYTKDLLGNYDFLLPLTDTFFDFFEIKDIAKIVEITERTEHSVKVRLNFESTQGTKLFLEKEYLSDSNVQNYRDGKIVELRNEINFNIGIFPFLKVKEGNGFESAYNDWYKVMLVVEDHHELYDNKDFEIDFYRNYSESDHKTDWNILTENDTQKNVKRTDRSLIKSEKIGSTYFTINNSTFDYMRVRLPIKINGKRTTAVLAPKWQHVEIGRKSFEVAIDFGTTNTFIALTNDSTLQTKPESFSINETDQQVIMLHRPSDAKGSLDIDRYERSGFEDSTIFQRHEFIPSLINKQKYAFPIRTTLLEKESALVDGFELLSNVNIAFAYQREPFTKLISDKIVPNLKWGLTSANNVDSTERTYIELFLTEIMYLVRNKILLNGGNPAKSNIIWFSPLSFTPAAKFEYDKIWKKLFNSILKTTGEPKNITESEAPFYYYDRAASINNSKCVVTIDIGGGSTDYMVSHGHKPQYGTSVNFAGNVLWGNGYSQLKSEQKNGIFLKIRDAVSEKLKKTLLKQTNDQLLASEGSVEIMNFWLANEDTTEISTMLNHEGNKLTYLLHLSSLIYHIGQLMLAKGSPAPTCIIFSGNGSKYVDFIQSPEVIGRLSAHIFSKIYGERISAPQIILPNENRKESTCFGGIFKTDNIHPSSELYLGGIDSTSIKAKNYTDLDTDRLVVDSSISENVKNCINILFDLDETLSFRDYFNISDRIDLVKEMLLKEVENNFQQGYSRRRREVEGHDKITESLFFYPIVGLIFKLSGITKDEIEALAQRKLFFSSILSDGIISSVTDTPTSDSIYYLAINTELPNQGQIKLIDTKQASEKAMRNVESYIRPVCDFGDYPDPNQIPKLLESGLAEKINGTWKIVKKAKVEFA